MALMAFLLVFSETEKVYIPPLFYHSVSYALSKYHAKHHVLLKSVYIIMRSVFFVANEVGQFFFIEVSLFCYESNLIPLRLGCSVRLSTGRPTLLHLFICARWTCGVQLSDAGSLVPRPNTLIMWKRGLVTILGQGVSPLILGRPQRDIQSDCRTANQRHVYP